MGKWTMTIPVREEIKNGCRPISAENGYVMNTISNGYIQRITKFIPIRAISFITGGRIPASSVPKLLSCEHSLFTAPHTG